MKTKGLSTGMLKTLAVLFMLLDHIGMIFFEVPSPLGGTNLGDTLDVPLRAVGRMAFPLFLFCLTEGYKYTHDKLKYAKRLFIFAVISEIPYDFGNYGTFFDLENNNVIWTMFIIIVMYICLDKVKEKGKLQNEKGVTFAYSLLIVCGCSLVAFFGHVDYGVPAICAAFAMYLIQNRTIAYASAIAFLSILFSPVEALALPSVLLVRAYNGLKGKQIKYFFYVFYPAHLIILRLLYMFIFRA